MALDGFRPVLLANGSTAGREDLAAYRARGGYEALARALGELSPARVRELVGEAGLTGRGGAGFPTARKWELAATAEPAERFLVANGGEHEPGSRKDRVLLSLYPHLVFEGALLAAWATGASSIYLYVIGEMDDAVQSVRRAVAAAREAGIFGSPDKLPGLVAHVTLAPSTYVAGEETAALEVIEGRDPLPREKPPYPGERGIRGLPTTINNVETLAHVPGIVRHGPAWFRALGIGEGCGTMLFTLGPEVRNPGVHELPLGATFRDLIEGCGGGVASGRALRGILPALSSAWLPGDALGLELTPKALRGAGSGLGCGGVTLLEEGQCAVERSMDIASFFAREQCGQCSPCRMETNTIAAALTRTLKGEGGEYRAQIEKIAAFTAGKGRCRLIEMAAAPILSALRLFPGDFAHHATSGTCPHPSDRA